MDDADSFLNKLASRASHNPIYSQLQGFLLKTVGPTLLLDHTKQFRIKPLLKNDIPKSTSQPTTLFQFTVSTIETTTFTKMETFVEYLKAKPPAKDHMIHISEQFPAIDAFISPNIVLQYVNDNELFIDLTAMLCFCRWFKDTHVGQKLQLIFVVSTERFNSYKWWQSYKYYDSQGMKHQSKFQDLSEQEREVLTIVDQYVMTFDREDIVEIFSNGKY
jgi:hypothetical protein